MFQNLQVLQACQILTLSMFLGLKNQQKNEFNLFFIVHKINSRFRGQRVANLN